MLLLLSILAFALAPTNAWGHLVALGIEGVTLLYILRTSLVDRRMTVVAMVAVALALLSSLVLAITGTASGSSAGLIGAMIVLLAPVAITRRLLAQERITVGTIWGALCLYLLAGLFFALLYAGVDGLNGQRFFAQRPPRDPTNYVYFSFVTLATLGYGDLTPAGQLGKLLAVSEAVGGQLYLVTIVAVLVSNIGVRRGQRRSELD